MKCMHLFFPNPGSMLQTDSMPPQINVSCEVILGKVGLTQGLGKNPPLSIAERNVVYFCSFSIKSQNEKKASRGVDLNK